MRLLHWGLATAFFVCYFTGDDYREWHVCAGIAALMCVAFRVVVGFSGRRHEQFADFLRWPSTTVAYARQLLAGRAARFLGHNPAGAFMIMTLLILAAATCLSGIFLTTDWFWGSESMDLLHSVLADATIICVFAHVVAAIAMSFYHRENLIGSMFSGRKRSSSD